MAISFYESTDDTALQFAVIVARTGGKYVFCKHRERNTLENPGGHREPGETILETARRELYEETGAIDFSLVPVCVYCVPPANSIDGTESFGMLYFAEIRTFEKELHSEIEKIVITEELPTEWTYPDIQPYLLAEARKRGFINERSIHIMRYTWIDEFLLEKQGVTKDLQADWNWIRYQIGGKMFAAVCLDKDNQPYYITLKLEPSEGEFLRQQYEDIIPGYYMNKTHWNSVKPDGQVPDDLLKDLLDKSYKLVLGSFSKKKQKEITEGL